MKRSDDKPLSCRFCRKEIGTGGSVIRTAAGPMHVPCFEENADRVRQVIEAAIAEGTHKEKADHFCGVCRQIVASIYYVGFDGTRMCPDCADRVAGQGPKCDEQRQREREEKWERQHQKRTVAA